jgi:hypothetical protein
VGSTGISWVGDGVTVSVSVGAGVSTGGVSVNSGVVVTLGVFVGVGCRPPASTGLATIAKPKMTKNKNKKLFFTLSSQTLWSRQIPQPGTSSPEVQTIFCSKI